MIRVFYAGLHLGDYEARETTYLNLRLNPEIYNGAYEFHTKGNPPWYRMDWTPVLLEDVPLELRTLLLLLT